MKTSQRHKKAVLRGLLVLAAAWCLWYARPVDIRFLSGGETSEILSVSVRNVTTRETARLGLDSGLTAGEPEAGDVWRQLESLRFRRNPLELVLQFLPDGGRAVSGYSYDLYGYDPAGAVTLSLHFDGGNWSQGSRPLPLYASRQVRETGQALGEYLWEHAENIESDP